MFTKKELKVINKEEIIIPKEHTNLQKVALSAYGLFEDALDGLVNLVDDFAIAVADMPWQPFLFLLGTFSALTLLVFLFLY